MSEEGLLEKSLRKVTVQKPNQCPLPYDTLNAVDAASAAQEYLRLGWAPVPVPHGSKAPAIKDWPRYSPNGRVQEDFQDQNIGLILGRSCDLIDVDCDTPEAIAAAKNVLPKTRMKSGRASARSSHFWYISPNSSKTITYDDPEPPEGLESRLIELRTRKCQTIVPPSVHPDGEQYEWEGSLLPAEVGFDEIRAAVAMVAATAFLARRWHRGSRHDLAFGLAGFFAKNHYPLPSALQLIQTVCSIAADEEAEARVRDVRATYRSVEEGKPVQGGTTLIEKGLLSKNILTKLGSWLGISDSGCAVFPDRARDITPKNFGNLEVLSQATIRKKEYSPFPTQTLPNPMRAYVEEGARALDGDPSFIALPCLAAAGAAIGNARWACPKRSWREPPVLWLAAVGPSGTLKSPGQEMGLAPLLRCQHQRIKTYEVEFLEYKEEIERWELTPKKNRGKKPELPVCDRIIASDVTTEALAKRLFEGDRGAILVATDELAALILGFDAYRNGKGPDAPRWLSMYHGRHLLIDRKGEQQSIYVKHACVPVCGGVQPRILRIIFSREHVGSGLVARFFFSMPPDRPKKWIENEIPCRIEEEMYDATEALLNLDPDYDEEGDPSPRDVGFSPQAKERLKAFIDEHNEERVNLPDEDLMAAWSKLEAGAIRLSLIHHMVRVVGKVNQPRNAFQIDIQSLEAGITLARWFGEESIRVYEVLGGSPEVQDRKGLIAWISRRGGRCSERDLYREGPTRFRNNPAKAEEALQGLVKGRCGLWINIPTGERGGPPTRIFELFRDFLCDTTPEKPRDSGDVSHGAAQSDPIPEEDEEIF